MEIKPVQPNNGTHQSRATIDELKASIGNIILSPSTSVQLIAPNAELPRHKPVALLLRSCPNLLFLSTLEGNSRIDFLQHQKFSWICPSLRLCTTHSLSKVILFNLEKHIVNPPRYACIHQVVFLHLFHLLLLL